MMNHSMKNQFRLTPGTVIEGKWHKKRYTILKELGYGANGTVYLAKSDYQEVALKLSNNGLSITSEVNVLKSFAKVQGSTLGPSLLDVDDWQRTTGNISFYIMEYIQGPDLLSFIQQKGNAWMPVLVLQLLKDLENLHRNGWVFGDLKPDNLIVTGPPAKIRCVDVGGTTIQGRAIKEFTEFFDRGYWGLGSRKAEPGYDLFAVAMIMINCEFPKRFNKNKGGFEQLQEMVQQKPSLRKYETVIYQALKGQYLSAEHMRNDLLRSTAVHHSNTRTNRANPKQQQTTQTRTDKQLKKQKGKKQGGLMETFLILTLVLSMYIIYIFGQLL
jgi:serine/threonine protein kinase